ncbi:MAG TPA: hypothetical protein VI300_01930 [Solirubrobacter sp.]
MKLLWILANPTYARNFEGALRQLAAHGHEIVLAVEAGGVEEPGHPSLPARLAEEYPNVTVEHAPAAERDHWAALRRGVAHAIDALRFEEPAYAGTPYLRTRAVYRTPLPYRKLLLPSLTEHAGRRRALRRTLRAVERAAPVSPATTAYLRAHKPDAMLVSPFVDFGAGQSRWIRSARAAGVRSCIAIYSWDALTVRGQIREAPDLMTVWNQTQIDDAATLHEVPRERVVATGAQAFDHWFKWSPSFTREAFCARVGLPADRPFVLYLASSGGYVKGEVTWVLEWIERLRASGHPELADAGVLVRPHPKTKDDWHAITRSGLDAVTVWPPLPGDGSTPIQLLDYSNASDQGKRELYDSIYHSAAVAGVNTSALIESAIVGRPVHTVLDPRWSYAQGETLHFRQLVRVAGGALEVGHDFDEHAAQLARSVASGGESNGRSRGFLEAFIRPQGLETEATGRFVSVIEEFAAGPAPAPAGRRLADHVLRVALTPVAAGVALIPDDPQRWEWAAKRRRRRVRMLRRQAKRRWRVTRRRVGAVVYSALGKR